MARALDSTVVGHIEHRKEAGAPTSGIFRAAPAIRGRADRFNDRFAVGLVMVVGSMWCAYAFAGLAFIALPSALGGGILPLIQWLSQTFIQLVMLSVIMVGQNILGASADRRAQATYDDATAILAYAEQILQHVEKQDEQLTGMEDKTVRIETSTGTVLDKTLSMEASLAALVDRLAAIEAGLPKPQGT